MNPFREGDKVYHQKWGESTVIVVVGEKVNLKGAGFVFYREVSFSPWPQPNHTRPFTPILNKGDVIIVKERGTTTDDYEIIVQKESINAVFSIGGIMFEKRDYEMYRKIPIKFN